MADSKQINQNVICNYSRTPVTRTLNGNEKQFELAGVRVIGVIEYSICQGNN